jgi:hypothetical protein
MGTTATSYSADGTTNLNANHYIPRHFEGWPYPERPWFSFDGKNDMPGKAARIQKVIQICPPARQSYRLCTASRHLPPSHGTSDGNGQQRSAVPGSG